MTNGTNCIEELAPLDLSMPRIYIRVLLAFKGASPTSQTTQDLQVGLERLFKQLLWLSRRGFQKVTITGKPSLEIRRNGNNAPTLVDKGTVPESYSCCSSYGTTTEEVPTDIWPIPSMVEDSLSVVGAPVFAASIFRFSDQGMGLCVCMHHNAVDGAEFSAILRLWARNLADPGFNFSSSPQNRSDRLREALSFELENTSSIANDDLFKLHPEYSKMPPVLPEKFPLCPKSSQYRCMGRHSERTPVQIHRETSDDKYRDLRTRLDHRKPDPNAAQSILWKRFGSIGNRS